MYSSDMKIATKFEPYEKLATDLLPHAVEDASDASHDVAHLVRVWGNVLAISGVEGGDLEILAAATLLHDCVDVPKDSLDRQRASSLAAQKAEALLISHGWINSKIEKVVHAIEAHSFSAQIEPITIEAKVLQDADRLDAIGYIGVARCFYVSGRLKRRLYDPADPTASDRELNDLDFAIDHFTTKLLKVSGCFQTKAGQALANGRHQIVEEFLQGFLAEVTQ